MSPTNSHVKVCIKKKKKKEDTCLRVCFLNEGSTEHEKMSCKHLKSWRLCARHNVCVCVQAQPRLIGHTMIQTGRNLALKEKHE